MAWRDRLRRRAAVPSAADGTAGAPGASAAGGGNGTGPDHGVSGVPAATVPGDWDGGWRRTAPPDLTVSRAPLGVSDGLAFRARLASWQNPSFDAGLGHALLPTAPPGLVRGVARPATPQAAPAGGGPLLLRALRPAGAEVPEAAGGPQGGAPVAGAAGGSGRPSGARASTPTSSRRAAPAERAPSVQSSPGPASSGPAAPVVRPSRAGFAGADADSDARPVVARPGGSGAKGRQGEAPPSRGITSADSPAVLSASSPAVQRAAEPGTGPVVTPASAGPGHRPPAPAIPLVRRVAVVPGTVAGTAVARPAAERTVAGPGARPPAGSGGRTPSGPAARQTATETPDAGTSRPAVRPRPAGPSLTVARRPAPVRRVTALRPAAPPAPATTPAPGAAPDAPGGPAATAPAAPTAPTAPAGTSTPPAAPGDEPDPDWIRFFSEAELYGETSHSF
ncbi:hypothetical protein AB0N19_23500, partial [Streptomyces sp. NPDC051132]